MKISTIIGKFEEIDAGVLVFFLHEKENFTDDLMRIDGRLGGLLTEIVKKQYFTGKEKEIHAIYTHHKIKSEKIFLVGLGKKENFDLEKFRQIIGSVIIDIHKSLVQNAVFVMPSIFNENERDIVLILGMSLYEFNHHKTKKNEKKNLHTVNIYSEANKNLDNIIDEANQIAGAVNWTRDMVNHPANHLTPWKFAKYAETLEGKNLKVKIHSEKELINLKMGLLLGVAKGSDEKPCLIEIDYNPKNYKDTIVLVGKGLTFDSGGISLKPSEKMDEMKMDMAGAAAVMGLMKVLPIISPDIRVIALIPATENLPSGKAMKPGDILLSASGQAVEVINTDGEGRLILGDALFYAQSFKPNAIIDMATLTDACAVALGTEAAAILGNNRKLINRTIHSGEKTGEKVWELPLWKEYRDKMKSEVADLKNSSGSRYAGVITSAIFLENFVGKYPWIHIDIGGTAFNDNTKPYNPKGATGYGVRLLLDVIENWIV